MRSGTRSLGQQGSDSGGRNQQCRRGTAGHGHAVGGTRGVTAGRGPGRSGSNGKTCGGGANGATGSALGRAEETTI